VRCFAENLDDNLRHVADTFRREDFVWGEASEFTIRDPKERKITAPCFLERVAHHAIMNLCEPVFERRLIHDSFACRKAKGRDAALQRARSFAGRNDWFLKIDIRKYFDSISHAILRSRLEGLFKDQPLLRTFDRIIRCRDIVGSGRGLPIGSLTSQHFANFYLGALDRYVKEDLRIPCYVRYMDDALIWGESGRELRHVLAGIETLLKETLDLSLKDFPHVNRTKHGVDFLGFRVFPTHLSLNRRSRLRFRDKIRRYSARLARGEMTERDFQVKATALVAFTRAAGAMSWNWRSRVVQEFAEAAEGHPSREPGRRLEQQRQELPIREPRQEHAG
jgi:hypothetical protein